MNIVANLDAVLAKSPERQLFKFYDSRGRERESYSRNQFLFRSWGVARGLQLQTAVKAGDFVILAFPPGLEMIAAFFGVLRVGAIPVPVPGLEGPAAQYRIERIGRDCSAAAVLTSGSARHPGIPTFSTEDWPDAQPFISSAPSALASDIAFLQYTSGSTSAPKGVMLTHGNILYNRSIVVDHEDPVAVTWLPQHHDMGLIGYFLYPALSGGCVHGFAPSAFVQRPMVWLDLITRTRATATSAPNFAFDHVLDRVKPSDLCRFDLSSMRFMMAAAEPVRAETYNRFLRAMTPVGLKPSAFYVAYGLAEATLAVTSYGRTSLSIARKDFARGIVRETEKAAGIANSTRLMSCGRPLGDTKVAIVAQGSRSPLEDGKIGEIWVAGRSVAKGYWQQIEATESVFGNCLVGNDIDRFLNTGDLGFILRGELFVCGRVKDVMIIRGQNIYPQDIEVSVARALEAGKVGSVVAFQTSGPDGDNSRIIVIAEVVKPNLVDLNDAIHAVRAEHGVEIDELILVGLRSIPLTTSGKPRRHQAQNLFASGSIHSPFHYIRKGPDTGDTRIFGWLVDRYQLGGTEHESLADIGITSLDLVSLMHEIQELLSECGAGSLSDEIDARMVQRLPVRELFAMRDRLAEASPEAVNELAKQVRIAYHNSRASELRVVAEDALLKPNRPAAATLGKSHVGLGSGAILLTGATGFLGPYLLASLLEQSGQPVLAMVRDADPEQGQARLISASRDAGIDEAVLDKIKKRVRVISGDLAKDGLGLSERDRSEITSEVSTIFHNGALVNYLFDYLRMRAVNVRGTLELLNVAAEGCPKVFNHISTTFIFGWATKPILHESSNNEEMELLDFGYSQSKWSSERIVANAAKNGLPVRIFRPALLTPTVDGGGNSFDITIRLLKFMIDHGIGVNAKNQVSFTPVDVAAANIVAISGLDDSVGRNFHVVRDEFSSMRDITNLITDQTGRKFEHFELKQFVPEVIRRCTREDLLFPLLDFLISSVDNIASMEFKRYESSGFQSARDRSPWGQPDPSLGDTVAGILRFMARQGFLGH